MNWKPYLMTVIPFVFGILVGAGLTRNKYVYFLLIGYMIISGLFILLSDKFKRLKSSTDKKIEARKLGKEVLNSTQDYIFEGHTVGYKIFDKIFPNLSIFLGLGLIIISVYLLWLHQWFNAYLSFFMVIIYILLINILRQRGETQNV